MKVNHSSIQIIRFIIQALFMLGLVFSFMPKYGIVGKYLFFTILLFGVFFCGWVCPFGSLQDWMARLGRLLKLPHIRIPDRFQKYMQLSRYAFYVLGTAGISFALLNARGAFNHNLFAGKLTLIAGIVLGIFVVAALFIDRPFCNYFCTKGAYYGLFGVLRPFGIQRDDTKCIHCHLCDKKCPMNIKVENTSFVRHPNCINCTTCISVCPMKCIRYQLARGKQGLLPQSDKTKLHSKS